MAIKYHERREGQNPSETNNRKEVHFWQPPCSCGVELGEALYNAASPQINGAVHSWQPPCSCGVSLDDAVLN